MPNKHIHSIVERTQQIKTFRFLYITRKYDEKNTKNSIFLYFRSIKTRACLLYMVEVYIHDNMTKLLSVDCQKCLIWLLLLWFFT